MWQRHKHGAAVGHHWIGCRGEGSDWSGGGWGGAGLLTPLTLCVSLRPLTAGARPGAAVQAPVTDGLLL